MESVICYQKDHIATVPLWHPRWKMQSRQTLTGSQFVPNWADIAAAAITGTLSALQISERLHSMRLLIKHHLENFIITFWLPPSPPFKFSLETSYHLKTEVGTHYQFSQSCCQVIESDIVAQKANFCSVELAFQALHCNARSMGKSRGALSGGIMSASPNSS